MAEPQHGLSEREIQKLITAGQQHYKGRQVIYPDEFGIDDSPKIFDGIVDEILEVHKVPLVDRIFKPLLWSYAFIITLSLTTIVVGGAILVARQLF